MHIKNKMNIKLFNSFLFLLEVVQRLRGSVIARPRQTKSVWVVCRTPRVVVPKTYQQIGKNWADQAAVTMF